MNQKDYDEIAKIIKECREEVYQIHTCTYDGYARKLANYFQKEKSFEWSEKQGKGFNKEQFLKDCGVEK